MRALKNSLLVIGSFLFPLLLLDIAFRLHPPQNLQVNNPYKYTRAIGYVSAGQPLSSYYEIYPLEYDPRGYYRQTNGGIFYFMDQFGGRWMENSPRRLGPKVGIFVGDSVTYGFGVRCEDTLAYQLGQKLKIDFINLAHPGYDSNGALAAYEKSREKIPHQVLIYGLHLNDLIGFPTSYIASNPLLGDFTDRSPFLKFVLQKWDIAVNQPGRIREITSVEATHQPFYRNNFAAIVKMSELAKEKRVAFYVLIFPVLAQLKENTFAPVYERLQAELRQHGIHTIDLTGGLAGYAEQDLWITPFDQHPNEIANKIFTEKVSAELAREPL